MQTYCWQEEVVNYKYGESYEIISKEEAANIGERKTSKTRQYLDGYNIMYEREGGGGGGSWPLEGWQLQDSPQHWMNWFER